VVLIAAAALRTLSYGNIGYAYAMVMLQAFNGAGDTITPTIVNFFGFWMFQIPLAWWLSFHAGMREHGVFLAIVFSECAIAAGSILLFRRGRWKTQKI
jgi:Na+-driven multidrug efflux pump